MSSNPESPGGSLSLLAGGMLVAALGIALLRDVRGFATWHSAKTVHLFWPLTRRLKRLPPWRWLPESLAPSTKEGALRVQRRTVRLIGSVFCVVGAALVVVSVVTFTVRLT